MLYFTPNEVGLSRLLRTIAFALLFLLCTPLIAQVNTGGTATTANHQKQIIGYLSNWDAWKAANAGLPGQGALTHLNIDYSKYTILNYSFFGVAQDGSLHSGDHRNKSINQPGAVQQPAEIFFTDTYSSWDLHLLFGELELIQNLNQDAVNRATAQGFQVQLNGSTWSHPTWGLTNKPLPVPLHKVGGAPGVLELAHSKGVKVMASIGGWSMCKHFPEMASDATKRQRFINDCVKLVNTGFDGIDLDWEFVGPFAGMNFTGTQADFVNFTNLVQAIRNAIGPNKLITAAFGADPAKLQGFEWAKLNSIMNYYNMMTYDFNGGWSDKAGHNSPLYTYNGAEAPNFNWDATHSALMTLGVPKNKINMGNPFYGRGVITSGAATLNGATVKRPETVQPDGAITTCADFTNWPKEVYDGTPTYFYLKQIALAPGSGWTRGWDNQAKAPYLTKGNFFLSYDDEESIGHKAQYINDKQLAGTIVWTVFGDLEISGSPTQFGTKLVRYSNVKSVLVNKINEVFAQGNTGMPTVSITAPVNGTNVAAGSNVVVNATASDAGGSISKVEFLLNGTKVGEDTSTPYTFTITGITSGSHTILARAIDNTNNTATASVSITAGSNPPPTVSIQSPSNAASFNAGANITINVNAADPGGSVTKVEFFQGGTKLGEDLSSPYSFTWNNVSVGNYALTAKATDNGNASATSAVVNITVGSSGCSVPAWNAATQYNGNTQVSRNGNKYTSKWWTQNEDPAVKSGPSDVWRLDGPCGGNINPTGSITAPANNTTFAAPASIIINATAADSDGTISKVEFFQGTTKVGEDITSPYTFTWSNVGAGTYSLTVRATDNANGTGTSSAVNITVTGNTPPVASITSPTNNSVFTPSATVTINATASDPGGSVAKVEFFRGTTKLGEDVTSPYSFTWNNVAAGNYSLTAKATDNSGLTGTSSLVNIVVSSNTPPVTSITSPANNTNFSAPASVTISANASDPGGSVTKVEFFQGSTKLGEDTSSPYAYSWNNVAAGSYSLTARATDNLGLTGSSAIIVINVAGGDNCSTIPQYVSSGGNYVAGSKVKNAGSQYECKPWPYSGWCNGSSSAYAPGTGSHWGDAWILKGSCSAARSVQHENEEKSIIESEDVSLYPNPGVSGKENGVTLIFESAPGNVMLNLVNANGTGVFHQRYRDVKTILRADFPVLSNGLYVIRMQGEKKSWVKKYLIK
jgi:chitinase